MSPASYLTAPPRVAVASIARRRWSESESVASIARMPLPSGLRSAFSWSPTVAGLHVFRRARAFMRTFKAFSGDMDRTMEKLTVSLDELERNSAGARLVDAQARSEPRAAQACRWPAPRCFGPLSQDVLGSVRRLDRGLPAASDPRRRGRPRHEHDAAARRRRRGRTRATRSCAASGSPGSARASTRGGASCRCRSRACATSLADYRRELESLGAERTLAVATSAVRDAENGEAFLGEVEWSYGFATRLLSRRARRRR